MPKRDKKPPEWKPRYINPRKRGIPTQPRKPAAPSPEKPEVAPPEAKPEEASAPEPDAEKKEGE